jgi:preprotein translocase subunit SecG
MGFFIGFLTVVLALDCLLLILLILIQLPKKEAGAGTAFGGQATDALFGGAGTGNALTLITKYAAGFFFGLCIVLAILNAKQYTKRSRIKDELRQAAAAAVANPAPPVQTVVPGASNNPPAQLPRRPNLLLPTNTSTPAAPVASTGAAPAAPKAPPAKAPGTNAPGAK